MYCIYPRMHKTGNLKATVSMLMNLRFYTFFYSRIHCKTVEWVKYYIFNSNMLSMYNRFIKNEDEIHLTLNIYITVILILIGLSPCLLYLSAYYCTFRFLYHAKKKLIRPWLFHATRLPSVTLDNWRSS